MAITLLNLVNRALTTIGEKPLTSLNINNMSPTAVMVRNVIELITNSLLVEADWNCARKTEKLEITDKEETDVGYLYKYKLPMNCLQVRQISLDGGKSFVLVNDYYNWHVGPKQAEFDIENGLLLSNSPEVVIKYTAIIDHSLFDPLLAEAFSAKLAAELAYAVTASTSNADYLYQVANKKLKKAISRNALNRNIPRLEGEVIGSRGCDDRYEYRTLRQRPTEETDSEAN